MSQFPQAPKADEPKGVEITHEQMHRLRMFLTQFRLCRCPSYPHEAVAPLLDALDDMADIVDALLDEIGAQEIPQC
ncbi:hypothetical protein CBA19CS91_01725 [Paraburkholderia hospita]|nr:hypothetical protein CBA19CS91_01725 [Paraburkholderia hospita]